MKIDFIKRQWGKRWFRWISYFLFVVLLLFLFRVQIYKLAGKWLIEEDELAKVEVMFVLSGNAEDRGREAAKLYKEGWAERIVCTGEEDAIPVHWPDDWLSMGEFTKYVIVTHGVDSNRIELIPNGTSTWEEHLAIVKYCKEQNLKKIMIVTSRFHTNRVRMVFDDPLEEAGIEWVLRGAVDSEFNESEWWEKEEGMIFVTNEYLKTIYYWWKY